MDSGTPLPRYLPLPQFLLDVDVSSTSKILFALLLNRANLSQKNAWVVALYDDTGRSYRKTKRNKLNMFTAGGGHARLFL